MEQNGSSLRPPGKSRRKLTRKQAAPRDERLFGILVVLVLAALVVDSGLFASLHGHGGSRNNDHVANAERGTSWSRVGKVYRTGYGNNDGGNAGGGFGRGGTSWSPIAKDDLVPSGGGHSEPTNGVRAADLSNEVDERVRKMIDRAGVTIDAELASELPTRDDLTSMYGEDPVIYGLDTCEAFRNKVPKEQALVAPAGMFNSGTNLMAELLFLNCKIEKEREENQDPTPRMDFQHAKWRHGMMWQVPWGKHVSASLRLKNMAELSGRFPDMASHREDVLPVVIVKDPYSWMGSMCRHKYSTNWRHSPNHCPNLVQNSVDKQSFTDQRVGPDGNVLVNVRYPFMVTHHDSLAGVWNDWYGEYHSVTEYPRLVVRYEDLLIQPELVVSKICQCAGGNVASGDDFRVPSDSAKDRLKVHEHSSGLIQALTRYGSPKKRVESYTADDLRYARTHIREDLMDAYGYVFPP